MAVVCNTVIRVDRPPLKKVRETATVIHRQSFPGTSSSQSEALRQEPGGIKEEQGQSGWNSMRKVKRNMWEWQEEECGKDEPSLWVKRGAIVGLSVESYVLKTLL